MQKTSESNDNISTSLQNSSKYNVAIMTWYHYRNYGTALQATALFKIILDMGYIPRMIQYRPIGNVLQKMNFTLFCKKAFRRLFGLKAYHNTEREKLFLEFLHNRLVETDPVKSEKDFIELNDLFDIFVCGSDQVWSPLEFNDKYYLSFVKDYRKKISYAPSFGVSNIIETEVKQRVAALVKDFKYLSVREKQGADLIEQISGQKAKVVLDPTLLLSSSEWDNYADVDSSPKLQQPYMLCYFLGKSSKYRNSIKNVSKKFRIPVYEIPVVREYGRYAHFPFAVGPREFVSLIKNAAFLFTDSFHGMVFSIIYRIPFAVFERFQSNDSRNQNSRIYNLLDILNLSDHLLETVDLEKIEHLINAKEDDNYLFQKLEILRQESIDYLEQSLSEAISC